VNYADFTIILEVYDEKITRKQKKRKRKKESKMNFFGEFLKITKHFFKGLNGKLVNVRDRRNQSYITYTLEILLFTVIMKNISGIVSMNKMTKDFNNDIVIGNISKSLGDELLEEIRHYDTTKRTKGIGLLSLNYRIYLVG
jgi:hypothetical protein